MKLDDIPKKVAEFEVPEGFFEQMEHNVLAAIRAEQAEDPVFGEKEKLVLETSKQSFQVPDGFFDKQGTLPKSTRVVAINWKRFALVAAAACAMGIGLFLWQKKENPSQESFAMLVENTDLTEDELITDTEEEILFDVYGSELAALADTAVVDSAATKPKAAPFVPKPGQKVNWDELLDDDFIYFLQEEGFDEEDL
jgi:hypothetical protein